MRLLLQPELCACSSTPAAFRAENLAEVTAIIRELRADASKEDLHALTLILRAALSVRRYHLPLSSETVPLRLLLAPLDQILETLQALQSPIEFDLYALLVQHGLAAEFAAQGLIPVVFVELDGELAQRTASARTSRMMAATTRSRSPFSEGKISQGSRGGRGLDPSSMTHTYGRRFPTIAKPEKKGKCFFQVSRKSS